MAFQMDITEEGLLFPDAYIVVESVEVSKEMVIISVMMYANSQKQFRIKPYLKVTEFCEHCEGDNPIASAYLFLKTLPEFEDAENC